MSLRFHIKRVRENLDNQLDTKCLAVTLENLNRALAGAPAGTVLAKNLQKDVLDCQAMISRATNVIDRKLFEQQTNNMLQILEESNESAINKRKPSSIKMALPGTPAPKRAATCRLSSQQILNEYLTTFDGAPPIPQMDASDVCDLCGGNMVIVQHKSVAACTQCGNSISLMESTTANMQYNTEIQFATFSYKRINHFNEWLQLIQAREAVTVPDDILQRVMETLYEQRCKPHEVTIKRVRTVLKQLKLRQAYDHVTQIVCRLTGCPPPRLHPSLEECCRIMFIQIQPCFEKHKGSRKNMLSYSFLLYKFCELLGVENIDMLNFSLLKGKDKLQRQDAIFQKICQDLDWQFIPSSGGHAKF